MSQYVNFYLRVNDMFAPIGSWSRASQVFDVAKNIVPYEHIKHLTKEDFKNAIEDLEARITLNKECLGYNQKRRELIINAQNTPLSEKLEAIDAIDEYDEETNEHIEELTYAVAYLYHLINMINEYEWAENVFKNDAEHYVYGGIEAYGRIEDVIEE